VAGVPIYILAGGCSSRFGSDKARAEVGGEPLIVRVAESLRPVAESVSVVADVAEKYADLGMRTIADARGGLGPIGGLVTAMNDVAAQGDTDGWLLLASCDIVEPRVEWVRTLLDARREGATAVAFRHRWWEPLLALYHVSIAPRAIRQIAEGDYKMQHLLDDVDAVAIERPAEWESMGQINTPDDLTRFE